MPKDDDELRENFAQYDLDGNGVLDAKELEVRETFRHFDRDGNGTIDSAEFGALLRALGGECEPEEVAAGIAALDTNANGLIEFTEFATWWTER